MRTIRLPSDAVCMKYTKWLLVQFGSTATPSRPPSPSVVTAFGTVPTWVFAPDRVTLKTLNESRSVTSAVWPSGSQDMPHGMVQPEEIWVMLDGLPPVHETVVNVTLLLGAEVFSAASRATTASVNGLLQARVVTSVEVAGGLPVTVL